MHPNQGALATLDDDAAIDRIAKGATTEDIAREYGCSAIAVQKRLKKHPDYKDAIALQADVWAQESMGELMRCNDSTVRVASARARGALDYAKLRNPDYREQATVTHELGESFEALIAGLSEQRRAIASQHQGEIDVTPSKSSVSD